MKCFWNRRLFRRCSYPLLLCGSFLFVLYVCIAAYSRENGQNTVSISTWPEVRHVSFFKVHKTGSTSIQNIFLRFGDSRNLTFVLGSAQHNECLVKGKARLNCISYNNSLSDSNIVPPPKGRHYDILCSHVVYNKQQFAKYLPRDTRLISLIREPVKRLESAIAFFDELHGINASMYAKDPTQYDHFRLNNGMAYEFGFPRDLFPNKTNTHVDLSNVIPYARQIIDDFDLILVNEKLNHSLVLMKRLFRWKTQDIVYVSKMVRQKFKIFHRIVFNAEETRQLRDFLGLDYALYELAIQELDHKLEKAGPGFEEELREFEAIVDNVECFCRQKQEGKMLKIRGGTWSDEFNVTTKMCSDLLINEGGFLNRIRLKQYGTLDTY